MDPSPESVAEAARVPGTNIYFLGCHESRVTVLSQQRRALNLVAAILSRSIVPPDGRIAIVGAGASGMTAAAGFAIAAPRLEIDLFEKNDKLLHLQENSDRHLHPYLYDWPRDEATEPKAGLPILNWRAGNAGSVARNILQKFQIIDDRHKNLRVHKPRFVEAVVPSSLGGCQVRVRKAKLEGGFYNAAVIAIGFGFERELGSDNHSYWTRSPLTGPLPVEPTPILFISGNGDGGLVDFTMAAFNRMTHSKITDFLVQYPGLEPTKEALLEIEKKAWQRPKEQFDIFDEYRRRLPQLLPDGMLLRVFSLLRPNVQIWLHMREPHLFRRDTAILNRFTTFLTITADERANRGGIHFRVARDFVGRLHGRSINIGERIRPLHRYLRFGPDKDANMEPFRSLSVAYKAVHPGDLKGFCPATPDLYEFALRQFAGSRARRTHPSLDRARAVKPSVTSEGQNVSEFLTRFAQEAALTPFEMALLTEANVHSYADIANLPQAFPSILGLTGRLLEISKIAAQRVTPIKAGTGTTVQVRQSVESAVAPLPSTDWQPGTRVPPRPAVTKVSGLSSNVARIDLRIASWPVRDQGQRGTTVAFACTGAAEHKTAVGDLPPSDLSEQFLYWAIKTLTTDPQPTQDGTSLQFARDALAQTGICEERFWPYNPIPGTTVTQATDADPSPEALADARNNRFLAAMYQRSRGGAAATVVAALQKGRPVVIPVPVFQDPSFPNGPTNWTTPSGWSYGRVLNPIPTSIVVGGHAVGVVGFEPDADEPAGGYFIIRNSWGTIWGSEAPSPNNTYSPEPGYGEISAMYVDRYLWEMLQL